MSFRGGAAMKTGPPEGSRLMDWNRSETLALANARCSYCFGYGLLEKTEQRPKPCNCVLRSIFRACFARFRYCANKEKYLSKVNLTRVSGRQNRMVYGRKDEEYMADFLLVTRRVLNDEEHRLFKFHFLLGADWKLCTRRLGIDRGTFFHAVYRIQQRLGRAYRELRPYPLYPLDDYFHGETRLEPRGSNVATMPAPPRRGVGTRPVTPPINKAA